MNQYMTVADFLARSRGLLQDSIAPYRYDDNAIVEALNSAVSEISRVRPDIFLDLKYRQPIPKQSPIDDGVPTFFSASLLTAWVPIPQQYQVTTVWYMMEYCQFRDVDDTQDTRAQIFSQKFIGSLIAPGA